MRPVKQALLLFSCGGMETTWRYAWALFLSLLLFDRPFPLPGSLAVFVMAFIVTASLAHRKCRVYQSVLVQISGFLAAWILLIYGFFYLEMPFFSLSWPRDWSTQFQGFVSFLHQLIYFAGVLLFWLGGRDFAKRRNDYLTVCLHFDKGLGLFFLLLLVKLLAQVKGGVLLDDPVTRHLMFAFFTFSLMAMGVSRHQSDFQKEFRQGFQGIGMVFSLVCILLTASAVAAVMLLPYLAVMSDYAQGVLKQTAAPVYPVLVSFIRFIFSAGKYRRDARVQVFNPNGEDRLDAEPHMGLPFGLEWVLFGVLCLMVLGVLVFFAHLLIRRLLRTTPAVESTFSPMALLRWLSSNIRMIVIDVWNGLKRLLKRIDSASSVYAGMIGWGRRSGFSVVLGETPIEYGSRLSGHFPQLKKEIEVIIRAFNREVYGNARIDGHHLSRIRTAHYKMRNPRYWVPRLRGWFGFRSK